MTADTALRLSKAFGTSPELWLNLQSDYDIQTAKRQIGKELAKIEPIATKAGLALSPQDEWSAARALLFDERPDPVSVISPICRQH